MLEKNTFWTMKSVKKTACWTLGLLLLTGVVYWFYGTHIESRYYKAEFPGQLPDFQGYRWMVPDAASNIIVRKYQGGHWITGEYSIEEGPLFQWAERHGLSFEFEDIVSSCRILDHNSPADQLIYSTLPEKTTVFRAHGKPGAGVNEFVYDKEKKRLYFYSTRM